MPKHLRSPSYKEVLAAAADQMMESLHGAIKTQHMVIACENENQDGSPHYCMYNLAIEKGWMENTGQTAVQLGTENAVPVYRLLRPGGDAFCVQYLCHHFESGPVVDLLNELFKEHPAEYKEWKTLMENQLVAHSFDQA